jgi:acyl-CoA synthetase (AMP-forming)/AMP-acid ligase II
MRTQAPNPPQVPSMDQTVPRAAFDQSAVRLSYAAGAPVDGTLCPEGSLAHLLMRAAARPDQGVVFVQEDDTELFLTYSEILRRARSRVAGLREAGIAVAAPVMLLFRDSPDFVLNFWACVLGGMVPVPMAYPTSFTQPNNAVTKLAGVWKQLGEPLLLADADFRARLADVEKLCGTSGFRVCCPEDGRDDPGLALTPGAQHDPAFIQYSSGSTGMPKGVVLTHRNLLTNLEAIIAAADMREGERFLSWMPYNHDMGIIGFHLTPLALRTTQVNITPFKFVLKPTMWLDKVHEHRCCYTGSPNFGYRLLLERMREEHLARWDL